jgi:Uncharacterised nucleotidyltransferase
MRISTNQGAPPRRPEIRARSGPRGARLRAPVLFPSIGPATRATLFYGIDGAPPCPTSPRVWSDDLPDILDQRLAGLALAAALGSGVSLDAETESRLSQAQLRSVARALTVESTALTVIEAFEHRRIPLVVTKGPGIADTYPNRSLRPFGDVDVLVPTGSFDDAMQLLRALGFGEYFETGEPRSYFNRRCREGVNLVRDDGASIDLHHHVPPWVWGERLTFADVIADSRETELAGGRVRVPHPIHNLLIAALHVISDRREEPGRKLLTWRDLVSLADVCDPDAVAREANRVDLAWLLAFVLHQLPSDVGSMMLRERLGRPSARMSDRFRLRRLLPPALGSKHQIAQAFRLHLPDAAAFLAGYAVPSRRFLRRRFGDPWAYTRWWAEAFGRLRDAQAIDPREEPV